MPIPDSNQRGNLYVKLNIDFSKSKTLSQDDLNVKRFIFIFKESSQLNFLKFLMHQSLSKILGYEKSRSTPSSSLKVEARDVPEAILNQGTQQKRERRQKKSGKEKVECAQM